MDKEQFYKEFFRYLECGSCADLEFCQKQLEPACKTGLAIYRKLKMEDLEKENEQLKQQFAEKEKEETKRMEDFEKGCQEYYKSNQTAIAELEKTKENMNNLYREHKPIYFDLLLIRNTIDQQIKSLKGEK